MNEAPVIVVHDVACARVVGNCSVSLSIPFLRIESGTVTMLAGPPASGTNVLLRVLGLLEPPDRGEVIFEGQSTASWNEEARSRFRARRCGYLFASPFLLPKLTVIENIAMPLFKISDLDLDEARARVDEVLEFAELQKFATAREIPAALQQRVALARALAAKPAAVFVEDFAMIEDDSGSFGDLLHRAADRYGIAVVGSGAPNAAPREGERRLVLSDGCLVSEVAP